MSKKIAIVRLSKQFGTNNANEVAGFNLETAAWIVKNDGGKVLAEIDPKTERYDEASGKVVQLNKPAETKPTK